MDKSSYKYTKTSRGINYHYYVSKARDAKPTIVFLHGFPSTSHDWHHQVAFFQKEGYGLIVPDLLGYGGTDRPADFNAYKMSLMTKDIVDIMDDEGVAKAIAIGHDWGAGLTSRLANYFSDRFFAFAFLAVSYSPPMPNFDIYATLKSNLEAYGSELFGYWLFFSERGADKIVTEHFDSFLSLVFPVDPKLWIDNICPVGAAKAWFLADKKTPAPSYISEADKEERRESLLKDGLNGGFNWYKAMVFKANTADASIPNEKYTIQQPVFFGAALQDYVSLAASGKGAIKHFCPRSTIVDFDTDHWIQLAAPDKTNEELLKWLKGIELN